MLKLKIKKIQLIIYFFFALHMLKRFFKLKKLSRFSTRYGAPHISCRTLEITQVLLHKNYLLHIGWERGS
jgi:hypothetical protein